MTPNWENIGQLSKFFEVELSYFTDEIEAVKQSSASKTAPANNFKRWLIVTIIGAIISIAFIIFTACMGIIVFTDNDGYQVIQTANADRWNLIVLIVISIILLIAEAICIVITVKQRKFKQ